ncbi:MAG TPA: M36 family metallopeptidase [Gaiellaceae bacterium]|nr:M36 family metallopeptidase [Gaiellaceae bacterium]
MPFRPLGVCLALGATLVALALVPGAMSASDSGQSPPDAVAVALEYVSANADELGVGAADVGDLFVSSVVPSRASGATHVNLNQRFRGLEVFGGNATISVARDGSVFFASGALVADLADASGNADLSAVEAVEAAADELDLAEPSGLRVLSRSGDEAVVSRGGISDETIPAKLGWQSTEDGLRLAWQVTIDDSEAVDLWNAAVDAETGALLNADNWTAHGSPNPVIDGSSDRVFAFPKGDPNDGPRTIDANPADAFASPFGWHDTNGVVGPEFTRTQGNNVHAYSDRDANNLPDPLSDPDGGATLTFDFPADIVNDQPQNYVDAAVTNLFYWCNNVHDLTYQYGFDEASGNFQVNNYGRGGVGGDDVRCEAQDGSGTNNANFSTPANDGGRPRMQMFLWPGLQFGLPNALTVDAPSGAAGTYPANFARFTPHAAGAGISGGIVLVDDGVAPVNDGCQPYTVPAGSIALVDNTSTCNDYTQTANAQAAGAAAIVLAHNTTAEPPILSGSMEPPLAIPAIIVPQAAGVAIKAGLPATGRVHRNTSRPAMRDADFRSETIVHEYGHGVSLRLTGGPNINCLNGDEQAGEGWSDFLAITFLMNPAIDDPEGPRGYGQWALYADTRVGAGFRPRPYSRNMELQPFTYDSIKTNAWLDGTSLVLPHGLGHGWAATLWDMAWDLVDRYGFNPNAYAAWNTGGNNRALQYVIDGLKTQGCSPGLLVARSAIIASQETLTGGTDTCTLWASFARRGMGFSAVQGTTSRNDNTEAFDTLPSCRRDFTAGADEPYGSLNQAGAGDVVVVKFQADGYTDPSKVLASNSPFSRKVDCSTLQVPSQNPQFVTPREFPLVTETQGDTKLKLLGGGQFRYRWQSERDWGGTCREFVLTRTDGVQHRAFFQFR